jgi:hypothetical protein
MPQARVRFTIRSLMIAIAVVAGLLALAVVSPALAILVSIPCVALIGSWWLVRRERLRIAGVGFWVLAIAINALYIACCIAPVWGLLPGLFLGYWVIALPVLGGLGLAWGILSTRSNAIPRRWRGLAATSLVLLTALPLVTVGTLWPLRLAFVAARPELDRLADQVAARKAVGFPQQVGAFRFAGAGFDHPSGNVGLMIDPNPSRPVTGGARPDRRVGPLRGAGMGMVVSRGGLRTARLKGILPRRDDALGTVRLESLT